MYLHSKLENKNHFFQKIKDLDYILLVCILLLGFISKQQCILQMAVKALFHTKSHLFKFIIFTFLMIVISF